MNWNNSKTIARCTMNGWLLRVAQINEQILIFMDNRGGEMHAVVLRSKDLLQWHMAMMPFIISFRIVL